jgi:hypothetical protein
MSSFKFEVINSFGVLSQSANGWTKEFKLISWNERNPKFDIREWAPDSDKMSRGITMNKEEVLKLKSMLESIEEEEILEL